MELHQRSNYYKYRVQLTTVPTLELQHCLTFTNLVIRMLVDWFEHIDVLFSEKFPLREGLEILPGISRRSEQKNVREDETKTKTGFKDWDCFIPPLLPVLFKPSLLNLRKYLWELILSYLYLFGILLNFMLLSKCLQSANTVQTLIHALWVDSFDCSQTTMW